MQLRAVAVLFESPRESVRRFVYPLRPTSAAGGPSSAHLVVDPTTAEKEHSCRHLEASTGKVRHEASGLRRSTFKHDLVFIPRDQRAGDRNSAVVDRCY